LRDLQRAAGHPDRITAVAYSQLSAWLRTADSQVLAKDCPLNDYDALLVRAMPAASLEQIVFRMNALAQLESNGLVVVNPARSLEVAIDKYLALARLRQAGFKIPETMVCQNATLAMKAFATLGGDVVVKPLFGGEGRGMLRICEEALALRSFKTLEQLGAVIYVQQFVPHQGEDWRLLVIGDRVLGMKRQNPDDWRTNISLGATSRPLLVTPELETMAIRASKAVGASIAGVDFLPARDGDLYALEVNAVPGWKALAATLETDVAQIVLNHITSLVTRPDCDSQICHN